MRNGFWRVGELAEWTGISVRTLHHYDEIGLLKPSRGGNGEERLYSRRDLARLERIVALKSLGLSLMEIREGLEGPGNAPREIFERKLAQLRERVAQEQQLVRRLETLVEHLGTREEATLEDVVETVEAMKMFEKYYTKEQLEQLKQREEELGPATMQSVQEEWPRVIAGMREALAQGKDPADPAVQALAKRWGELLALFTGGDPAIARSLSKMHQSEPSVSQRNGLDPQLMEYVGRARAALRA
ncbi:MAG: MerR family transcriptional regulator [Planctomycetes bacterium]|nr:MerR family transcriptional regulator [Planctomycetota bacterium]